MSRSWLSHLPYQPSMDIQPVLRLATAIAGNSAKAAGNCSQILNSGRVRCLSVITLSFLPFTLGWRRYPQWPSLLPVGGGAARVILLI